VYNIVMLKCADSSFFRNLKIPAPLPPVVYHFVYIVPLYFGFAVSYDVYNTIRDIVLEQSDNTQAKIITQGITGVKNITAQSNTTTADSLLNSTAVYPGDQNFTDSVINTTVSYVVSTAVPYLPTVVSNFTSPET